jgi:hypothetical protein
VRAPFLPSILRFGRRDDLLNNFKKLKIIIL